MYIVYVALRSRRFKKTVFFLEGQASKSGRNNIVQKDGLNYLPKVLRENKFIYFKYIKYQNVIFKLKIHY